MNENISITFGIMPTGEYLFYARSGKKFIMIKEDEVVDELEKNIVAKELEVGEEGVNYVCDMYQRWLNEYIKGRLL